jgi:hypothetical protein
MGRKVYKFTGTRKLYNTRPTKSADEDLSDEMNGIFSDEKDNTKAEMGANINTNNFLKNSMNVNPNIMQSMMQPDIMQPDMMQPDMMQSMMQPDMMQQPMMQQPMMQQPMMQQPMMDAGMSEMDPSMQLDPSQYMHMGKIRKANTNQSYMQNVDPAQLYHLNKVQAATPSIGQVNPNDYLNSLDMMGSHNMQQPTNNLKMLGNMSYNMGSNVNTSADALNNLTQLGIMGADMKAVPGTNDVKSFLKQGL